MKQGYWILLFTLFTSLGFSQVNKVTVNGQIKNKISHEEIPYVSVIVQNTTYGTVSDEHGKYVVKLEPGKYRLIFKILGFKTIIRDIVVPTEGINAYDVELESAEEVLSVVTIKSKANKKSEEVLVQIQKEAVEIKTAIGAEELSKKGVGDVAAAVTKAAGVTKQEGGSGSVFVRGLGDRYNVTTLNGLPLPSNNPSNKNISLDIFTTDIVEYVGISKTFEPLHYADFGGANIDINAKKFSGKPFVEVGLGLSANTNVTGLDNFYLQDGPSYNGFGVTKIPTNPTTPTNYTTSWDRIQRNYILNNSFALNAGEQFNLKKYGKLKTFATATFDADNDYLEGITKGGVTAQGFATSDFYKKSYKFNTNTTLMGTADYIINKKNSLFLTTLFLNSTAQDYNEYNGSKIEFDGGLSGADNITGIVKRATFDKTQLLINQLHGKHKFTTDFNFDWSVGLSNLNNDMPDRKQNTFVPSRDGSNNYTFFTNSPVDNHRYFQELNENEFSINTALSYAFFKDKDGENILKATAGFSGRSKQVDFVSNQFNFKPKLDVFNFPVNDIHQVDSYFTDANYANGDFIINKIQQSYTGNQSINAGFVSLQANVNSKLTTILGGRFESIVQNVDYITSLQPAGDSTNFSTYKFLPSFIGKYQVNDQHNLKMALSKTYTLPQFKEKVELLYEEVAQGYVGNPDLYESTNYNADLGWEFFPDKGELISITTFGKIIKNPMNEIFINSASGDISYVNSGEKATVLGVELELKKDLMTFTKNDLISKLTGGFNASYLNQNQDLSAQKVSDENDISASFTFDQSKLTGASDILANADVSFYKEFSKKANATATLSYAYFSDKLAVIGTLNRGDLIDKAIHKLDFIVKGNINEKLKIGFKANNLLNPVYERIQANSKAIAGQKDVLISSYKRGIDVGLSVGYKF